MTTGGAGGRPLLLFGSSHRLGIEPPQLARHVSLLAGQTVPCDSRSLADFSFLIEKSGRLRVFPQRTPTLELREEYSIL